MRPLDAEVLIDALNQITGTQRAVLERDSRSRTRSSRPTSARSRWPTAASRARSSRRSAGRRATPGCSRSATTQPTAAQRLYLLNSGDIQRKLQQGPKLQALLQRQGGPRELMNALYLTILSRYPTDDELQAITEYAQAGGANRRGAAQDLAWALVNSAEFRYPALSRQARLAS